LNFSPLFSVKNVWKTNNIRGLHGRADFPVCE
jgi:hypothetical protein